MRTLVAKNLSNLLEFYFTDPVPCKRLIQSTMTIESETEGKPLEDQAEEVPTSLDASNKDSPKKASKKKKKKKAKKNKTDQISINWVRKGG